jgi:S-layer like family, C-terminal region
MKRDKRNITQAEILTDKVIDQKKLHENNIILIGGTRVNTLTRDLSSRFAIQYVQIGDSDNFFSRISGQIYSGSEYAVLQAIKNPFAANKVVVIAFGSDVEGTKRAISILNDIIIGKIKEEELKNKIIPSYPAKIISQYNNPPWME